VPDEKSIGVTANLKGFLETMGYAEMIEAATSPAAESLRHICENLGIKRMMESFRVDGAVLRASLRPIEELRLVVGPREEVHRQQELVLKAMVPIEAVRRQQELMLKAMGPMRGSPTAGGGSPTAGVNAQGHGANRRGLPTAGIIA
jgi:hypothetical protein